MGVSNDDAIPESSADTRLHACRRYASGADLTHAALCCHPCGRAVRDAGRRTRPRPTRRRTPDGRISPPARAALSAGRSDNSVPFVQYYPVYLDLRGRPCLVVGGGEIAARKVEGLLAAGARVTVVSPTLGPALTGLAETHEILHHARPYRPGDLAGVALAFAATDDPELHAAIAGEAAAAGVPLNVVDRPAFCTFIAPAILARGTVTLAISTGGASPALAAHLRRELEGVVGPEYALAAEILGKLRPLVTAAHAEQAGRARVFAALAGAPLLAALRAGDTGAIDALLATHVGAGTTLASLGVTLDAAGGSRRHGSPAA